MARAWCRHKSPQIQRTACLRSGAGQTPTPERLGADDSAYYVAVDIDIARPDARCDSRDCFVDPGVQAEGQAIAGRIDLVDQRIELLAVETRDMQNRAEDFALNIGDGAYLDQCGGDEGAVTG